MSPPIDALLFDLGGVVIHNDLTRIFTTWARHAGCDVAHIREHSVFDEQYERYERGEIEIEQFFDHLRAQLEIDLSDEQFLEGWNAIFVGEMPGISAILRQAAAKFPLYAFSNTNRAHEAVWSVRFAPVLSHFEQIFASSTIGLRKPDAAAFDHVVKAIGAPASRIMFFDDVRENIAGAEAAGLRGVHTTTSEHIAAALSGFM